MARKKKRDVILKSMNYSTLNNSGTIIYEGFIINYQSKEDLSYKKRKIDRGYIRGFQKVKPNDHER